MTAKHSILKLEDLDAAIKSAEDTPLTPERAAGILKSIKDEVSSSWVAGELVHRVEALYDASLLVDTSFYSIGQLLAKIRVSESGSTRSELDRLQSQWQNHREVCVLRSFMSKLSDAALAIHRPLMEISGISWPSRGRS